VGNDAATSAVHLIKWAMGQLYLVKLALVKLLPFQLQQWNYH